MAWSLARRKVDVVCLEQGDWVPPALRPKNHLDWEVRARRSWSPSPNIRQWPSDYPVASYGDDPISVFIYNAVGGSTIGYAGNFWRFTPSDFRVRSLDGVARRLADRLRRPGAVLHHQRAGNGGGGAGR